MTKQETKNPEVLVLVDDKAGFRLELNSCESMSKLIVHAKTIKDIFLSTENTGRSYIN